MGNKKYGCLKLSMSFFIVIITAIVIALFVQYNPIRGAEPTGTELTGPNNIITAITFELTTDVPISQWDPNSNYDVIKLNVKWSDSVLSDGTNNTPRTDGIQNGNWFKVGIQKSHFHNTLDGISGNILRLPEPLDLDQTTPIIGNYYVDNNISDPDYYWLYVVFNQVPSMGTAENGNIPYYNVSGNVFLNLAFDAFNTNKDEPYTANFPNSAGFTYTLTGKSPGLNNVIPFQKYGEMLTITQDGKQQFFTDNDGAYQLSWFIKVNHTLDDYGNLTSFDHLIIEDKLGNPVANPTHEYVLINNMPAFALYEYIGTDAVADLQNGTLYNEDKSIIHTNTTNFTRAGVIYNENNINGHSLSEFMTLSSDGNAVAFDLTKVFGTIDKPFRLDVYTKTTPAFSFPNYDLNGDTGTEYAKAEYLQGHIKNEVFVDGIYKDGVYIHIPKITHGAQAVGENFGKLKLNKVSDTNNPPTLITTGNPTFDLYKNTGNNQWEKLYEIVLTNGTFATSNIDYGTYRLIETKAPEGYLLDQTPHDFIIGLDTLDSDKIFTYEFLNTKPVNKIPTDPKATLETTPTPSTIHTQALPKTGSSLLLISIVLIISGGLTIKTYSQYNI